MKFLVRRNKGLRKRNKRHPYIVRTYSKKNLNNNVIRLTAPNVLSLSNNIDETLSFFDDAIIAIKKAKMNQVIYFNLKNIEIVSADAIMYLIALINNTKRLRALKIKCQGNLPDNEMARAFIENSGFYSYVSGVKSNSNKTNNIRIERGNKTNTQLDEKICDFVNQYAGCRTLLLTKRLYRMIIELMANTGQHAYSDLSIMYNNWYIYVEQNSEYIDFVFLDTGIGIPNTIRKNFIEIIQTKFLNIESDAAFISSALRGAFRTETKCGYRGKGLPGIYEDSCAGFINDMMIISGKGYCQIIKDGTIEERKLLKSFQGTLYCWKFNYRNYKELMSC